LSTEKEKSEKIEVIESLKKQLKVEGELVVLYDRSERAADNKAMQRLMQMFRLDSQRHINLLQAAIEVIEGEEVYIEDREPLAQTLGKHLELEKEALDNANRILAKLWVSENKGLKGLLEIWRDDEKRHHKTLRDLTSRPYFRLSNNDMVAIFRGEEFLEKRYRRSKEFMEKQLE
jgi:hypothetical protein